jgi:hypothetical protein
MASKLFHSLVGFGISLGAAVACGGASAPQGIGDDGAAGEGMHSPDAGTDAPPDAFCDASWPTTKGQPGPPLDCVDPLGECAHLGHPIRCATMTEPWTCESIEMAAFCVDGAWSCEPNGRVPLSECRCWCPTPNGYVCTENGIMPAGG